MILGVGRSIEVRLGSLNLSIKDSISTSSVLSLVFKENKKPFS